MKRATKEKNRQAILELRAIIEAEWSDGDLAALHDRLWQIAKEATRQTRDGLSLPELCIRECHYRNGARMSELPSPRGGTVADHVPPGYRGFAMAKDQCIMEELVWNLLPTLAPLPAKEKIAAEQWIKAVEMLCQPGGDIIQNHVRVLIAEAQYYVLISWHRCFEGVVPQLKRPERIDAVVGLIEWMAPALLADQRAEMIEGVQ